MIPGWHAMFQNILDIPTYFGFPLCVLLYNKIFAKRQFVLESHISKQISKVIGHNFKHLADKPLEISPVPAFTSRRPELSPRIYKVSISGTTLVIAKVQNAPFLIETSRMLCKEYASLRFAGALISLSDYAPKPLFFGKVGSEMVLVETFLSGMRISDLIHSAAPEQVMKHFMSSAILLAGLAKETRIGANEFMRKYQDEMLKLQANFSNLPRSVINYFASVKNAGPIPKCVKHGDYFISNVLVSECHEVTGLTDYEDFSKHGFPFEDIYHFIVSYLLALERMNKIECVRTKSFIGFIENIIAIYNKEIGMQQDQMDAVFKYYWLSSINRQVSRFRKNEELALYRIRKIANGPQNLIDFVRQLLE